MPLRWKSELELGIFELDTKQEELFVRFEDFSEKTEQEYGSKEVGEFLGYLDGYAREHFEFEEDLQDKSNFPGQKEHAAEHRQFVQELDVFRERLVAGEDVKEIALLLKRLMIRWLIKHNNNLDKVFRDYLLAISERTKVILSREKLGEILVESGLVEAETLELALESQKQTGKLLGAVLIEMGAIKLQAVIEAQAVQNGMLSRECLKY